MESPRKKALITCCILASLVFMLCFGAYSKASTYSHSAYKKIANGDIILRRGKGLVSDIARNFSKEDKRFSHVGILAQNKDDIVVVHSISDDDKGFNGVVVEKIQDYLSDTNEWAIFRVNAAQEARNGIAISALAMADKKVPFDNKFSLETKSHLYCSEFVLRVVNKAVGRRLISPKTKRFGRIFVSISDIYLGPNLFLVSESNLSK